MRTTINLDDSLITELMNVTGAKKKREAIHLAIAEFIHRKKLEGLKALSGKIRLVDNWQELEDFELKEQERQERRSRGHR